MSFIFMDESGDLGFNFKNNGTTRNFIVTFLFVEKVRLIEKVIKKTFKILPKSILKKHCGSLYAFKEKLKTNEKLLNYLVKCNDFKIKN